MLATYTAQDLVIIIGAIAAAVGTISASVIAVLKAMAAERNAKAAVTTSQDAQVSAATAVAKTEATGTRVEAQSRDLGQMRQNVVDLATATPSAAQTASVAPKEEPKGPPCP